MDAEVMNWTSEQGEHFVFRLWLELPTDSRRYVTDYIKLFAREHSWRVHKVVHKKFTIEIIAEESPSSARAT